MKHAARASGGARHRTGRILPVLCVALLAIGAAHAKDNRKPTGVTVAGQVESSKKPEPTRDADAPPRSEPPRREDPPRREEPPKREDPRREDPRREDPRREDPRREDPRREDAPRLDDPPRSGPKVISMDKVVEQVQKRYQARVVRADRGESDGRSVYRLRVLTDTAVKNIVIDAETGKELK